MPTSGTKVVNLDTDTIITSLDVIFPLYSTQAASAPASSVAALATLTTTLSISKSTDYTPRLLLPNGGLHLHASTTLSIKLKGPRSYKQAIDRFSKNIFSYSVHAGWVLLTVIG